ncbi:LamG-like jellyroll fold domain-containing protein [Streptomyces sp. NPDC002838]|uniref:LamG-like jellyroll fold domain-containing protein n=1 Tax=Streptomyces sp. NPDC002838 TaxID=3154436 RepID=UPI00332D284C
MTHTIVEVAFGHALTASSPTLTDISQYVDLSRGIDITRGAENELGEIQPGTCSLVLDNSDGRFTPDRPGAYYPNVKLAVPIRVSVATFTPQTGSVPYPIEMLSDDFDDNRVNTALWPTVYGGASETGGRARIRLDPGVFSGFRTVRQWTLTGSKVTARLISAPAAGGSSTATASMWVHSTTSGTRIGWSYNPVTNVLSCQNQVSFSDGSPVSLTYSAYDHMWLRVRETAGTVYWESSRDGATWTVRRSLATPAWVTSQTVDFEFTGTRTGGTGDYAEWDWLGATVHPRFFGLVNQWPVAWKGLASTATITCSDLFTWASITKPLKPMLVQEVLLDRPTVYYPLTEPEASASAGDLSGTQGVGSLSLVQTGAGGTLEFGAGTGPASAGGAPVFTPASTSAGKYLTADLGPNFVDANTSFRVRAEAWFSTSTNGRVLMALASSDGATKVVILLESGTGKLALEKDQGGNGTQSYVFATPNLADGALHHMVYNEFENLLYIDGVSYSLSSFNGDQLRTLSVGGYRNTRLWSGTIAHVAVYCRSVTAAELSGHYTTGTTEHIGEAANARLSRLASYAGVTVSFQGSTFDAVASQAALGSSALDHMREIEATESGKLLTTRNSGPLLFQSRDVRYNPTPALTLSYPDLETDGVKYAYDNQKLVNTVTASRPGGATQRVLNQASIDTYGEKSRDLQLFKNSDNSALDAANWLVSRYANPVAEVRQVPVEAYSMPVATYRALLDADVSTVIGLTSLPDQAPAATTNVFVEGYTERIGLNQHHLDFYTSRADTDTVWVLDDPTYSVLDSTTRLAY